MNMNNSMNLKCDRLRGPHCLLLALLVLVGGCAGRRANHQPLASLVPLPSLQDQKIILTLSKKYTNYWINGELQKSFSLMSPASVVGDQSHRQSWIKFLSRQRHKRLDVVHTDRPQNIKCVPASSYTFGKVFIVALSPDSSINENNLGTYDAGMHLIPNNVAMVQFSLNQKIYHQVWVRDSDAKWRCIHFPLDLDQQTIQQFEQWK
jgi:hypothetical protein